MSECGSAMVERKGRYGKFQACGNFPACKYIKKEKKEPLKVVGECPDCGGDLVERFSKKRKSSFVGCANYPKCKHISKSIEVENTET